MKSKSSLTMKLLGIHECKSLVQKLRKSSSSSGYMADKLLITIISRLPRRAMILGMWTQGVGSHRSPCSPKRSKGQRRLTNYRSNDFLYVCSGRYILIWIFLFRLVCCSKRLHYRTSRPSNWARPITFCLVFIQLVWLRYNIMCFSCLFRFLFSKVACRNNY